MGKKYSKPKNKKIVPPPKLVHLEQSLKMRGNQISKNNSGNQVHKYNRLSLKKIYSLALLGLNNQELAEFCDVSYETFQNWITQSSAEFRAELYEILFDAREGADAQVANKLYQRAKGYRHKETKYFCSPTTGQIIAVDTIKQYPPSEAAAMYILNNKRSKTWKNKVTAEGPNGEPLVPPIVQVITDPEKIKELLKQKHAREKESKLKLHDSSSVEETNEGDDAV